MPVSLLSPVPLNNQLLSALTPGEYALLFPYLERVWFDGGRVLYEAGSAIKYAYVPLSGVVSLLATTEDGRMIEIAVVGNEGVIGLPIVLGVFSTPYRALVQIKGSAMRIRADALRRQFNRGSQLQVVLLGYIHTRLTQVSQALVCNHFHTVEQRFSSWLLTTKDRVHTNRLHLTQQHISDILGTPRTNVTMCASVFQHNKFIQCTRGQITIIDQQGLETCACECYREMKEESSRILAA